MYIQREGPVHWEKSQNKRKPNHQISMVQIQGLLRTKSIKQHNKSNQARSSIEFPE